MIDINDKSINRSYDVFIANARKDEECARRLISLLNMFGISCFSEVDCIEKGMEIATAIQEAIKKSKLFIVLCSKDAEQSAWVRKEIDYAISLGKNIVPITNEVKLEELSVLYSYFAKYNYFNFSSFEDILNSNKGTSFLDNLIGTKYNDSIVDRSIVTSPTCSKGKDVSNTKYNFKKKAIIFIIITLVLIIFFGLSYQPNFSTVSPSDLISNEQDSQISQISAYPYYIWITIILLLVFIIAIGSWFLLKYRKQAKALSFVSITTDIDGDGLMNEKDGFEIFKSKPTKLLIDRGIQNLHLDFVEKNRPKRLSCFIAGSTALQQERDAIRSTISVVYNRWKDKNFQILSYTYEDFTSKVVENGQQSLYNNFIENVADIAVFILKGNVGEKTSEEFEVAYSAYSTNRNLSIIVYYFPEYNESESVKEMKKMVENRKQYWIPVASIQEMKLHFTDIINTDIWNLYAEEI